MKDAISVALNNAKSVSACADAEVWGTRSLLRRKGVLLRKTIYCAKKLSNYEQTSELSVRHCILSVYAWN